MIKYKDIWVRWQNKLIQIRTFFYKGSLMIDDLLHML